MKKMIFILFLFVVLMNVSADDKVLHPKLSLGVLNNGNGFFVFDASVNLYNYFEFGIGASSRIFSGDYHGFIKLIYPFKNISPFLVGSINYLHRGTTPAMYTAADGFISTLRAGFEYYFSNHFYSEYSLGFIILFSEDDVLKELIGINVNDQWFPIQPGISIGWKF